MAIPEPHPGPLPVIVALIALVLSGAPPQASADDGSATARELLDAVDDLYRGKHSYAELEMHVTTANWSRTLRIESWSRGTDQSLMRILSPRKERGTATLRSGNEIWNYLPRVKRVIKLPSSMMGSSWMGSHFTNDDLIKESRFSDDFTFKISFRGKRNGIEVIDITCLPRSRAAVVWGKIVVSIAAEGKQPIHNLYYDEDMKLARTLTFSNIKQFGDRRVPSVMVVTPANKPGESTRITYHKLDFDRPIPEGTFSLRALRR